MSTTTGVTYHINKRPLGKLMIKSIMFCGYAVRVVRGDALKYCTLRYYRNPTPATVSRVREIEKRSAKDE